MNDRDIILHYYKRISTEWSDKYGESNFLFELHSREDNVYKAIEFHKLITRQYKKITNVVLVHTSDPVGLCHLFKTHQNSNITVISDHPTFGRLSNFFSSTFATNNVNINPLFDDFSQYLIDADLVVFPEYEYFIPLDMVRCYNKNKNTAILYYIDRINSTNSQHLLLCEQDLEEMCNFNTTTIISKFKNINGRTAFYAFGKK